LEERHRVGILDAHGWWQIDGNRRVRQNRPYTGFHQDICHLLSCLGRDGNDPDLNVAPPYLLFHRLAVLHDDVTDPGPYAIWVIVKGNRDTKTAPSDTLISYQGMPEIAGTNQDNLPDLIGMQNSAKLPGEEIHVVPRPLFTKLTEM
jgi:hypothetical protein